MISRHVWPILPSLSALTVHACRVSRSQLAGIGSLTAVALGAVALSGLTGCSVAGPRQSPLPHDGPTMVEIYRQHMSEEGAQSRAPSAIGVEGGASGLRMNDALGPERESREWDVDHDTASPLTDRFQRLPNPDLVMHVYAHLADGKYPVPGYVTVFPMYESVQYALPGEVAPRYSRRSQPAASATRASTEPSGTGLSPVSTNSAKAY